MDDLEKATSIQLVAGGTLKFKRANLLNSFREKEWSG